MGSDMPMVMGLEDADPALDAVEPQAVSAVAVATASAAPARKGREWREWRERSLSWRGHLCLFMLCLTRLMCLTVAAAC
jgi:hypothetical protein